MKILYKYLPSAIKFDSDDEWIILDDKIYQVRYVKDIINVAEKILDIEKVK